MHSPCRACCNGDMSTLWIELKKKKNLIALRHRDQAFDRPLKEQKWHYRMRLRFAKAGAAGLEKRKELALFRSYVSR